MKKRGDLSNGLPPDEESGGGDYQPRPAGLDRTTELELIDAALPDNIEAFSQLFEHYRPALYGLCCRRLNDPSLAEDVLQEAFLKAFKNLSSYDRGKPVWPWLSTIAHRMCVDLQRHRSLTQYFADLGVAMDEDAEVHGHARSALDEVMASEESAELWRAVRALPKRQRRALLLYAQDGMSYADIAAAEGISIGAVKLLIVRARKKMRTRVGEPLPAIVLPFSWLRWKVQRIEERVRPLLSVYGEGFSNACVQAVCLGTVAMTVVAMSQSARSFEGGDAMQPNKTVLPAADLTVTQSGALQSVLQNPNVVVPAKAPAGSQQSAAEAAGSLADQAINPNQNATPENSSLYSITASPNYESDHAILAAGHYWQRHFLFVSHDGGASWKPQVSRVALGVQHSMVLSPGYPQDRQIFTLGELGLQQSDDGGEIFRTVSPLLGNGLAISPSLGRGDPKLWIGTTTIFEYDVDTGVTVPVPTIPPARVGGTYASIAFSPIYPTDPTVFVSSGGHDRATIYRCKGMVCDETEFPFPGSMAFRLSPRFDQDGLAYAFTPGKLLVSKDGGRTFQEIQIPLSSQGQIGDVAIWWNASSGPAIFVSATGHSSGTLRSLDAGRSWSSSPIDVPGFQYGASKLIVMPTGRLLTLGNQGGLACSEDGGQTWAPRCTPEQ